MHYSNHEYWQVNDSCEVPEDLQCLRSCRDAFDREEELPAQCSLDCTENRPLLFVDNDDVAVAGTDSRALAVFLEVYTNTLLGILGMYVCSLGRVHCKCVHGSTYVV